MANTLVNLRTVMIKLFNTEVAQVAVGRSWGSDQNTSITFLDDVLVAAVQGVPVVFELEAH